MKITSVKVLESAEPKGVAEVEKELLEKHEQELQQVQEEPQVELQEVPQEVPQEYEDLDEQKVLSYIGKRYNKQINSFDELMSERKEAEELPEDVSEFLKYKKETGRGINDFIKLNQDYESMEPSQLVKDYLMSTQEGLDEDDIEAMMEEYEYDEDIDDESRIKKVKIERKKIINEAKKYFNGLKDKYKVPLESSAASMSDEDKQEYESYRKYTQQAKTIEEENNRKRQWFNQKTDELFSGEFKGFEFDVNDKKITFNPGDVAEVKKAQSNPQNFINKFLDESGLIKDVAGYHKSLSIAMNPEKFAKFFYEQGKSDATDDVNRKMKNVNMSERKAPEFSKQSGGGIQVRVINPDSGNGLKIRRRNN
jgi:hypothetical protein